MSLSRDATQMSATEFQAASTIICDLALFAVAGCRDVMTSNRSARAANLAKAKATIKKRLQEFDLTLEDVAAECGISLGYMHKLFRDDEQTAWGYLKRERLQLARQLMVVPSSYTMSVTDIALSCGFSNMSQFSTAFRQAFSVSPREVLRGTNRSTK
jgi:AraC-like DNA-binding protein